MSNRVIEQRRAEFALKFVSEIKQDKKGYSTLIKKLPAMVLNNGLGHALVFLLADAKGEKDKPSYLIYEKLESWLHSADNPPKIYTGKLMESLTKGTRAQYMHARHETLKLLAWMTKFADAYLADKSEKK